MNNYEKIKQMSVEEMAAYLASITNCGSCKAYDVEKCMKECTKTLEEWLLSEVEE